MTQRNSVPVFWTALFYLAISSVSADIGDRNTMKSACESGVGDLKGLCEIVNNYFKSEQDSYIHLGGEFYLVSAPNTGRIGQGVYAVNVRTGQLVMYGGYGLPSLGEIKRLNDGTILIAQSQMSMSRGHYWEGESVLQVRKNPISETPYIVSRQVRSLLDASEELRSFCEEQNNRNDPDCAQRERWGRKVDVTSGKKSSATIVKAHQEALDISRRKSPRGKQPFKVLEDAGVRSIIDSKPGDMSLHQYVKVLNDYASFSYQYGEGRNDLAIEIFDRVIKLVPGYTPAYLNMANALQNLAKWGASRYTSMPLGPETIANVKASADNYMRKYQAMILRNQ